MRPRATLALYLIIIMALAARAQEPAPPERVSPELLSGRALVLREDNCSIDAPGAGWEWLVLPPNANAPDVTVFFCRGAVDARGEVIFQIDRHRRWPELAIDRFLDAGTAPFRKLGHTARTREVAPVTPTPLALGWPSFRFDVELTGARGQTIRWRGYVLATDRLYVLSSYSPDLDEPAALKTMVASFHLIAPPPQPPISPAMAGLFSLAAVIAIALAAFVANRIARRSIVNGGLVATGVVLAIALARVILAPPDADRAARIGIELASQMPALFIAVALAARPRSKLA